MKLLDITTMSRNMERKGKVDPIGLVVGSRLAKLGLLPDVYGSRSLALAYILDMYELWRIETEHGSMPWGTRLYDKLRTWEIIRKAERLGEEINVGLGLKLDKIMTIDEALRLLEA